ncbi:MAG TPA: TM2 domain-containing protein [Saprospiraceae bacterium]|nr:TM2 domain-containing protein [Saprospiraceae bacterium]HMQ84261.1 TM2 domain-containing protein [Saprospiraceae bacterium]
MKNLILLLLIAVATFVAQPAQAFVHSAKSKAAMNDAVSTYNLQLEGMEGMTVQDFLNLSPKQIREKTGQKLSLKESIALKLAQKKVKKSIKKSDAENAAKSQLVALLLVVFVGGLGIHRFYLGYTTIGIIQLLTLGGCGIWALIDLIRIITGDLGPADGSAYDPTL